MTATEALAPFDQSVRVGDVSPTEPEALGAWLRALSERTILSDEHGDAWERGEGDEHAVGNLHPDRVFPALLGIYYFGPCEISEGRNDVHRLEPYAPFTVLALGNSGAS